MFTWNATLQGLQISQIIRIQTDHNGTFEIASEKFHAPTLQQTQYRFGWFGFMCFYLYLSVSLISYNRCENWCNFFSSLFRSRFWYCSECSEYKKSSQCSSFSNLEHRLRLRALFSWKTVAHGMVPLVLCIVSC